MDAERVCAWRAHRAEGQDGPSKDAYGAFSERAHRLTDSGEFRPDHGRERRIVKAGDRQLSGK